MNFHEGCILFQELFSHTYRPVPLLGCLNLYCFPYRIQKNSKKGLFTNILKGIYFLLNGLFSQYQFRFNKVNMN